MEDKVCEDIGDVVEELDPPLSAREMVILASNYYRLTGLPDGIYNLWRAHIEWRRRNGKSPLFHHFGRFYELVMANVAIKHQGGRGIKFKAPKVDVEKLVKKINLGG